MIALIILLLPKTLNKYLLHLAKTDDLEMQQMFHIIKATRTPVGGD
jgi:hypothetical protein